MKISTTLGKATSDCHFNWRCPNHRIRYHSLNSPTLSIEASTPVKHALIAHGQLEIDKNSLENAIRPCALRKKNFFSVET